MASETMDWRRTVLADVDGLPTRRERKPGEFARASVELRTPAYDYVARAAQARSMSTAAYMRRAALAMAAHDAGIPVTDLFALEPRVTRETGFLVEDPEGTGFGSWQIEALA